MSGIVGAYHLNGSALDPADLERMVDILAHRGPDGVTTWRQGPVGLGHRRLHTTPESIYETLPQANRRGDVILTADARIDNREELASLLGLRHLESLTDADLILAAYDAWGEECASRLLGDFAFAVWDIRRQHLFCARDHFGVKPFYYTLIPGELFAFASEIKALLVLQGVPQTRNDLEVARHLIVPVRDDGTETFYRHVRKLAPAHTLTVTPNGSESRCYWRLDSSRIVRFKTDREYAEAFRDRFVEAVRCRLRSAYPVGAMLSGGLDSSAVACVAAQTIASESAPLKTFSGVYEEASKSDERAYIDAVLRDNHMKPHFFVADRTSPLAEWERVAWHLDGANDAGNLYLNWNLNEAAQAHGVRILLEGFDGDTTVSHGYGFFEELTHDGDWVRLLREIRAYSRNVGEPWFSDFWASFYGYAVLPKLKRYGATRFLLRAARALHRRMPSRKPSVNYADWKTLLNPDFIRQITPFIDGGPGLARTEREDHWRLLMRPLMHHVLELLDGAAAAFGVEVRYPFYDKRLVEFCLALPPEQKIRRGWTRWVFRQAMEGILPEEVRMRPDKANLSHGFHHALRTYERDHLEQLIVGDLKELDDYVNVDVLSGIAERYVRQASADEESVLLWRLLALGLWLQKAGPSRAPRHAAVSRKERR